MPEKSPPADKRGELHLCWLPSSPAPDTALHCVPAWLLPHGTAVCLDRGAELLGQMQQKSC